MRTGAAALIGSPAGVSLPRSNSRKLANKVSHLLTNGRTNAWDIRLLAVQSADGDQVENEDGDMDLSLEAFQKAKAEKLGESKKEEEEEFDGYKLRDILVEKWGACYDVDFNRVDSFGFRNLYLNVLPFRLGKRPFRHESEYDYLCHLQAIVEILQKYEQLDYVLYQIQETNKRPIAGRNPLVAVPLRLDLTRQQVEEILGY